jgi:hypothetical protein
LGKMKSTHKEPAIKFRIPAFVVRVVSGSLLALVIYWLSKSLGRDDLVLVNKYRTVVHLHGQDAWLISASIFCIVASVVGFLNMPKYRHAWRSIWYLGWSLFVIGFVIAIFRIPKRFALQPPDYWTFCIIIFCFAFIVVLLSLINSQFSGWNSFAKRYPTQIRPSGNSYRGSMYYFGKMLFYPRGVRVIFTNGGIYFYMMFLSRVGHQPFLLPWESVERFRKCYGFFENYYLLEINDAVGKVHLDLPKGIEAELSKWQKDKLVHK